MCLENRSSPYDNVRLNQYYPTNFDNNLPTYRSFQVNTHECIRADLV